LSTFEIWLLVLLACNCACLLIAGSFIEAKIERQTKVLKLIHEHLYYGGVTTANVSTASGFQSSCASMIKIR
jgi:hypothetical protein